MTYKLVALIERDNGTTFVQGIRYLTPAEAKDPEAIKQILVDYEINSLGDGYLVCDWWVNEIK